ncbi:unnamed protein product [Urochloa humidicola]
MAEEGRVLAPGDPEAIRVLLLDRDLELEFRNFCLNTGRLLLFSATFMAPLAMGMPGVDVLCYCLVLLGASFLALEPMAGMLLRIALACTIQLFPPWI